jgi:hypothetical protein
MTCLNDVAQCPPSPCASKPLTNLLITGSADSTLSNGQITFGDASEPWVSYTYAGQGEPLPTLDALADGTGFHVTETFAPVNGGTLTFAGVGLSFNGDGCIDGSNLTGLQFDFSGELGGSQLMVGVVSNNNVSAAYPRGTCTAGIMCYGPTVAFNPVIGSNPVRLAYLGGQPTLTFDPFHIVNVQWQVSAGADLSAHFTISNVRFVSGDPPDGG